MRDIKIKARIGGRTSDVTVVPFLNATLGDDYMLIQQPGWRSGQGTDTIILDRATAERLFVALDIVLSEGEE